MAHQKDIKEATIVPKKTYYMVLLYNQNDKADLVLNITNLQELTICFE